MKSERQILERILRDKKARREVTTRSFEWFFAVYYSRYIKHETPDFHREMFKLLEDENVKLGVFVAFRGSAKSTIITNAYVIWSILGKQQKKFVMILSQTSDKSRQFLMNIKRELESNSILRGDLGPFKEESGQWGSQALVIPGLGARIAIGSVETSIRGALFGEHRPDLIVLDDVEDMASAKTREGRNKTYDWFTGEVVPAGDQKTRIIAAGNLLHDDSLLKRLERRIKAGSGNSTYREYPIVDNKGDPLWPGKFPTKESIEEEREKVMSEAAWQREYLLKIISTDEQVIRREWIRYYDVIPEKKFHDWSATGIDLAISLADTADFTAMVSGQVRNAYSDARIYILPNPVNKRLTSLETIDRAKQISDALIRGKLYIEDVGYQGSIVEHLKRDGYPGEGVKVYGMDKRARLASVSYLVQSGRVMFPRQGAEELIEQLVGFGSEKHDDLSDAFAILLAKVAEESKKSRSIVVRLKPGEPRPDALRGGRSFDASGTRNSRWPTR